MKAEIVQHKQETEYRYQRLEESSEAQGGAIANQDTRIEMNSTARIELEEGFECVRTFATDSAEALNRTIVAFKSKMEAEFTKVCDKATADGVRIADVEIKQTNFQETQVDFQQQLHDRKVELDKLRIRFQEHEPLAIMRTEFDSVQRANLEAIRRLGDENIAQQFELNVLNNFVDKYAPIRIQHQLSTVMRSMFDKLENASDLYDRYEKAESAKFEELHQILFMDGGKADIVDAIEKMNLHVAREQKLGDHRPGPRRPVPRQGAEEQAAEAAKVLAAKSETRTKYTKIEQLDRVRKLQEQQHLDRHTVPKIAVDARDVAPAKLKAARQSRLTRQSLTSNPRTSSPKSWIDPGSAGQVPG